VNVKNQEGKLPYQMAKNPETAALLRAAGRWPLAEIFSQVSCTCQYFARPGGRRAYTGL